MSSDAPPAIPRPSPITPYLTVSDAAGAIAFYRQAFAATEVMRMNAPNGTVLHATLIINGGTLYLSDECPAVRPEGCGATPAAPGGSPVGIHLQVDDADFWFTRAVAAGATEEMPPTDMFWGDRFCKVRDPFGHRWSMAAFRRVVSEEEMRQAVSSMFGAAPSGG